jgi:aspartate ammonia-lyase
MVKKAAAIANMNTTRLYSGLGNVMCQAADEIIEGKWNDQFIVDPIQGGAGTSMNMNVNEVIANALINSSWIRYPVIGKFSTARIVCIP